MGENVIFSGNLTWTGTYFAYVAQVSTGMKYVAIKLWVIEPKFENVGIQKVIR